MLVAYSKAQGQGLRISKDQILSCVNTWRVAVNYRNGANAVPQWPGAYPDGSYSNLDLSAQFDELVALGLIIMS